MIHMLANYIELASNESQLTELDEPVLASPLIPFISTRSPVTPQQFLRRRLTHNRLYDRFVSKHLHCETSSFSVKVLALKSIERLGGEVSPLVPLGSSSVAAEMPTLSTSVPLSLAPSRGVLPTQVRRGFLAHLHSYSPQSPRQVW